MEHHHKHETARKLLLNARGQIESAIKMIEEGRYCVDISKQIMSTMGFLKKANLDVLTHHIETCVAEAVKSGDASQKLEEIKGIMAYLK